MKYITLILLFFSQISFSQSSLVSGIVNKIEFEEDSIKSVYDWVTDNIKYDVAKLKKMKTSKRSNKNSEYNTQEEYEQAMLIKVIKQKKGVCEDYALLFNSIIEEIGYRGSVIEGYTRNSSGKIDKTIGHAWNAVEVEGEWRLYDLTWGAGNVENEKKFIKSYTDKWYNVSPSEMIKSHMPYDPIWQLLNKTWSYKNFENETLPDETPSSYNFKEQINADLSKTQQEQLENQLNRSKEIGDGIRLIDRWRKLLVQKIDFYSTGDKIKLLNSSGDRFNESAHKFNDYLSAKNNRFKSKKWAGDYPQEHLQSIKNELDSIIELFESTDLSNKKSKSEFKKGTRLINDLLKRVESEIKYLKTRKK